MFKRFGSYIGTILTSSREMSAVVMLIIAGGRFRLWEAPVLARSLSDQAYAALLTLMALALLVTTPWRERLIGRTAAALAAALLAGIVFDASVINSITLLEAWTAVCLATQALRRSYEC